jgi:hypothetical protein
MIFVNKILLRTTQMLFFKNKSKKNEEEEEVLTLSACFMMNYICEDKLKRTRA